MRRLIATTAMTAAAAFAVVCGPVTHWVKLDHYGGVYGTSIGTDSHYCSVEDRLPIVTCETVR